MLLIPEKDALAALFADRQIEIGEFGYRFADVTAHYLIITYRMPRI